MTVAKGILTIKAERHIDAIYGHGILEVTAKLAGNGTDPARRKIPVRRDQHVKPT